VPEITVEELKAKLDHKEKIFILDVREPSEYEICHLPGSRLIPLSDLPAKASELNGADDIVVHCKAGVRSTQAVQFLQKAGFKNAVSLAGGIDTWAERIDPSMPTY
jgi:adenylyltransferase/sulfurtransferase